MDTPVETEEYKGCTIKVMYDPESGSPRKEWDNFGKMVCFHRRYDLGDENDFAEPRDAEEFLKENEDDIVHLPLYLYDHSGITMSTTPFSCPWDSGQVGFIYADKETIIKEHNAFNETTKAMALKMLKAEVKTYDQYITGQVYGYVIENADGEEVGSLWGMYGSTDYVLEEARIYIDEM